VVTSQWRGGDRGALRVCLVVGEPHDNHCGVRDYTLTLAQALREIGVYAEVVAPDAWKLSTFGAFRRGLCPGQVDVLHVQYPSIGYRGSLLPHLAGISGIARRTVVTVHEFSALPKRQQLSMHMFRLIADRLVFVSEYEQTRYRTWLRGIGPVQQVVPIGSNIPACTSAQERSRTVLYFGQIRPNKGLEPFLELASTDKVLGQDVQFVVAGSVPSRHTAYFQRLRSLAPASVEWRLNLSFEEVAELMSRCLASYLPFPDGASLRRGSLLAAFNNGLPVISTTGPATGPLRSQLLVAKSSSEAVRHLESLITDPEYLAVTSSRLRSWARQFSWERIAREHKQLYLDVLRSGQRSGEQVLDRA
jgi:glycosyltransferase involved in cell wall biosynthesis